VRVKPSRTGLITDKVSLKGFRNALYISSPFPKLAWRNPLFRFLFRFAAEVERANSCLHLAGRRHMRRCISVSYVFANQTSPTAGKIVAGLGSSGVAGLSSIPLALFGNRAVWLGLLIIGVLITGIGGVLIGLLG
jgi:hypothetical protein